MNRTITIAEARKIALRASDETDAGLRTDREAESRTNSEAESRTNSEEHAEQP